MTALQEDVIASRVTNLADVPLGEPAAIDAAEYARTMRGVMGDGTDTPVSAFNSSI